MNSEPLSVVLVEDNLDVQRIFELILQSRGYRVRCFDMGATAFAAMQQDPPAAAIIDIGLPDMSGFELADSIRQAQTDTLLVALTGHDAEVLHRLADRNAFAAHFVKPCELGQICDWIEEQLGQADKTANPQAA